MRLSRICLSLMSRANSRRERRDSGGEKEASGGFRFAIGIDPMGNESRYGSEPGYRGDAEFGYGDEFDDEEEDAKPLFWEGNVCSILRFMVLGISNSLADLCYKDLVTG